MYEDDGILIWEVSDIRMAIKRYFLKLDRNEVEEAGLEIEFLRAIHREWSYNPLMRRTDPAGIAIIDDLLQWLDSTPVQDRKIEDFTIRRLLR